MKIMSAIGLKLFPLRSRHVLPGFRLSLGFTLFYLTSLVLIPLLALVIRPMELGPSGFWAAISTPRVLASLRLSFGMALAAAVETAVSRVFDALCQCFATSPSEAASGL